MTQNGRLLAALLALTLVGCSGVPSVDDENVPLAGQVWFGTTFDPETFAIPTRITSASTGDRVAWVAGLVKPASNATAYLGLDGVAAGVEIGTIPDGSEVAGSTFLALQTNDGNGWTVQVIDAGGNVLARGSLAEDGG